MTIYTLNEWCALHRCGRVFAYKEIKAGRLKARKQGSRTIITQEDDDAYTASLPEFTPSYYPGKPAQ